MSAGKASFAPTSASFGSGPSDAYFLLESNTPGPVTIAGSLSVLGPLSTTGTVTLATGAARSLSTTGDAAFNGGITVGSAVPGSNEIVGYNGASVTTTNIPFGVTVIPPGTAPTAGNSFRVDGLGVLTNMFNVTGAADVVIPLGQYAMFCAAGQTASDGGVSFSPPAPYSGFVGGYAVGSVRNGQNVLVEVAQLGTGSIRLVCVSPTGTPAGAGIDVTLISLLRLV